VREKLNLLLEKHCVTIKKNVELLGEHLSRAQQDGVASAQEALREANALAHQLKGSSGTAGFHDICVAATALYDHLKGISEHDDAPFREGVRQAIELYARLSRASKAATPQSSTLYLVA
jgi:HPt (histidine-containing phosphotransfer) domain-containing protein